jgi:hypothetical protein
MVKGLDKERVFRVRVPSRAAPDLWRFGSGYRITSDCVLTAQHVLARPDEPGSLLVSDTCEVQAWPCHNERWEPSSVLWLDVERDLALVSISSADEAPAVCFGELSGSSVERWEAIGFPLASLGATGRQPEPASGTTMGLGVGNLPLTVTSRSPNERPDTQSGWAGLSGAAVFCAGCLVGVIRKDVVAWDKSLEASEIAQIVTDSDFLDAIGHPIPVEQVSSSPDWMQPTPSPADVRTQNIIVTGGVVTFGGMPAQGSLASDTMDHPQAAATAPPAESSLPDLEALVETRLEQAGPLRTPIIVAVETTDRPVTDEELLRTRRHLTVSLSPAGVERCVGLAATIASEMTWEELTSVGSDIWKELVRAQPRLTALLEKMGAAAAAQPVAWAGHSDLLDQLGRALLFAHTGTDEAEGFIGVGYGGHYLQPVLADSRRRWLNPRGAGDPEVAIIEATTASTAAETWPATVRSAVASDIVVAFSADEAAPDISVVASDLTAATSRSTRALFALGSAPLGAEAADRLLTQIPFLSVAPHISDPELRDSLGRALEKYASRYALPCIVSAVRAAWLGQGPAPRDAASAISSLEWTNWSWVGQVLFSPYVQPEPATYPHLDDLRSVAGSGWYYVRHKGIPDDYTGEALSSPDDRPERRFHLYLSGAGGTGKSCFLRFVHNELEQRANRLAVWYRVDVPGSSWDTLQRRIREEVLKVARKRQPEMVDDLESITTSRLSVFLLESAKMLRERVDPNFEIDIFIDQLERTFESSDEPDPARLESISEQLLLMLEDVQMGQGVRVFIASRKQYLPDFLRSSRAITDYRLEFNVLQPLTDEGERKQFVRQVVDWCREEQLVGPDVEMRQDAAEMLVSKAKGNPLNTMLALIQLLSADVESPVTTAELERHRPWEQLFALDLAAARQDDIDWYFLLAMAHTRTEIVRFEDVWWRLRLVDPRLTQQVDGRRAEGVLEQLWFHGLLGRTIYPRAAGSDPARYVEFFHANLRDHLLSEVMASGTTTRDPLGARTGAPAAWRALDRLAAFAQDWEQTQQLLPGEDVRALLEHRDVVVESHQSTGSHAGPFDLLFLRQQDEVRPALMRAAAECFVLSALVRDDLGAWAFQRLFPSVDDRIALSLSWLRRSSLRACQAVLRYVVEQEYAWNALTDLLLDDSEPRADETAGMLADILDEPLLAARFRNDLLSMVIESAARAAGSPKVLPIRVVRLVVTACGFDSDSLVRLVSHVRMRAGIEGERGRWLADGIDEGTVGTWLEQVAESGLELVTWSEQPTTLEQATLGLVLGENLTREVRSPLDRWSAELRARIRVPIPSLQVVRGECLPDELELRFATERVQANVFYVGRLCLLRRHWESTGRELPPDAVPVYDAAREEDVVWLEADVVKSLEASLPVRDFDQAVVDWLEAHCRREFDRLFDDELVIQYVREAREPGRRGLAGYTGDQLRSIIVGLVEEGVPLEGPGWDLNRLLGRLGARTREPATIIRLVRDVAKRQISASVGDSSGLMNTIVLDEKLEQSLADSVRPGVRGEEVLRPDPGLALAEVASAVRRQVEKGLRHDGLHMPVLVTQSRLRAPLSQLLRQFDVRLKVLSFTELDPQTVAPVLVGVVNVGSEEA